VPAGRRARALLAAGRLHRRRHPGGEGGSTWPAKGESWAQRVLREPRFGLAVLIGAVVGTPGASYITALHQLITSKSSTATQAVAVVIFVIIEFALVIVPYAFHRPNPAELIVLPSAPSLSRSQAATADGAGVTLAG
jgi:hypothetical protein